MRRNKLARWILAAVLVVAALPGMAQEEGPILLPKPKPAAATLLVMCDLACNWKLDGVAKGRIEAGGSAKANVMLGQHVVVAVTEDGADQVKQLNEVKSSGQTVVSIELKPVRDARLKAEQEAKDKAKLAGATLLVMCDLACNWKLDGEAKGHIEAGGSAKAKVELGQHLVAGATDDGTDQIQQPTEIKADGQTVVSLELKPVRDARLKARQVAPVADPNDPASPHAPGIYLVVGTDADRKLVPLEACEFQTKHIGSKASLFLKPGAVATGSAATIKTLNVQPVFFIYFPERGISQNPITMGTTVSPDDFMLLRLTVNSAGNREAQILKATSAFGSWHPADSAVPFNYSKIGPSAYKVTLPNPLQSGEYGFISFSINNKANADSLAAGIVNRVTHLVLWLFDFGVPGGQ
jgi:hypothetical protein